MSLNAKLLSIILCLVALAIATSSVIEGMRLKGEAETAIEAFAQDQREDLKNSLKNYMDIAFEQLEANYANAKSKDSIVKRYGSRLHNVVDMSMSLAEENMRKAKAGEISEEEAKSLTLAEVKHMRFDDGYVWIQDLSKPYPKMLMHPAMPSLDGKSSDIPQFYCMIEGQRRNILAKFAEDAEASQTGDAYLMYLWPKPMKGGLSSEQPKLSYVKVLKGWNWLFGSGVYVDEALSDARESSLEQVRRIRFNKGEGYFWIHDMQRPIPKMLMHPIFPKIEGKTLDDPSFSCVGASKENIFEMALRACENDGEGYIQYQWPRNPKDPDSGLMTKLSYVRAFKPFGWVVGTGLCTEPYIENPVAAKKAELAKELRAICWRFAFSGVVMLLAAAAAATLFTRRITSKLALIVEHAGMIAKGDLAHKLEAMPSKDETGSLVNSIERMTENLNSLVGQVQRSSAQIAASATQIAASAKEQEAVVNEFGASANQIAASSEEISVTSQQLAGSMDGVAAVANHTAELAESGRSNLDGMRHAIEQLAAATGSISGKLSTINEKANRINSVVVAITKVSEQTNLLSLNASIEAEKAGEYGKGFSVVAKEIRRLADHTAVATLDITRMVKDMQSAVSSGVMEMDKFSEEVRRGVRETDSINSQLESILEEVKSLPPVFNDVTDGMKQQSLGAQQIARAIVHLSDAARQTASSLKEFNEATAQLNNATQGLQGEVSIFKVKG